VGEAVLLGCHTSLNITVHWSKLNETSQEEEDVYYFGEVFNGFKTRYTVEQTSTGDYNLHIRDLRMADSGRFMCQEYGGFGDKHYYRLFVKGMCMFQLQWLLYRTVIVCKCKCNLILTCNND